MSSLVLLPRIVKGFYPERRSHRESKLDNIAMNTVGNIMRLLSARSKRFQSIVDQVNAIGNTFRDMREEELREQVNKVKNNLKANGFRFDIVARTFALVREFSGRRLGMRHFDVQIAGGWVLLNGMVAEMETGEGKTLAATLPACTAALAGIPVHIITVNDYLARRDAEWMRPIYDAFGLRVGVVTHGISIEDRRSAYRCDITYCTNKEIVFDYLKDRLLLRQQPGHIQMSLEQLYSDDARLNQLILRGLSFAIVDEADSILIDEARTPLIISGPVDNTNEKPVYQQALGLADKLNVDEDYTLDVAKRTLELTEQGKSHLKELVQSLGGLWMAKQRREGLVRQALTAKHLFTRDREYIVRDNKVQIVDEYTGRVMADRSWEQGLHQLIESKEGCNITTQNETLARISYQRFFRRYHHLAGMTGTAREVANELWAVYRLKVVTIPTNKPLVRLACPYRIYRKSEEKWSEVVKRIAQLHKQGRPVLLGTRSVEASEHLSKLLTEAGLPHRVLNARQDKEEAQIIAQAGQKAQITVATNMAGRGTDIALGLGVKELGGLHVIATELHDAKRIDRQLFGRCGRQGDPGSFEAIVSLEDNLFAGYLDMTVGRATSRWTITDSMFGRWIRKKFATYVQRSIQRRHFHIRRDLLKFDESLESAIAFSGRGE